METAQKTCSQWRSKLWYAHEREYDSVVKRNEHVMIQISWENLEIIRLTKRDSIIKTKIFH